MSGRINDVCLFIEGCPVPNEEQDTPIVFLLFYLQNRWAMNTVRPIYMDHAATTPMRPEVKAAMLSFFDQKFGNPSSLYAEGREARVAIDRARDTVAKIFSCQFDEVVFVGSGTESDNLSIMGAARAYQKPKEVITTSRGHIITTQIEHHAVLRPCEQLEKEGFEVTYLEVDRYGRVSPEQVIAVLRSDTILVSVMYANNEVGTIEPIAEIGQAIATWKEQQARKSIGGRAIYPYFHTDACQASGFLDLNVLTLGVDLMTINGSKIYGPKGVGVLFVRKGVKLQPIVWGGGQEKNLRSGTENVAGIVGLARALELAQAERDQECTRLLVLREKLIKGMLESLPKTFLNGHPIERLPNNVNITILDIEGEALLLLLDQYGIAAATGSACDSQTLEPSHVILALGLPYEAAHGSLRLTLGRGTTQQDVDEVLQRLPVIVDKLRKASPVRVSIEDVLKVVEKKKQYVATN